MKKHWVNPNCQNSEPTKTTVSISANISPLFYILAIDRWVTVSVQFITMLPPPKFLDLLLPLCGPSDTFLWPKGARTPDFLTCWLRPKGGQRKDKLLIPFQGHSVAHCFAL